MGCRKPQPRARVPSARPVSHATAASPNQPGHAVISGATARPTRKPQAISSRRALAEVRFLLVEEAKNSSPHKLHDPGLPSRPVPTACDDCMLWQAAGCVMHQPCRVLCGIVGCWTDAFPQRGQLQQERNRMGMHELLSPQLPSS